MALVFNQTPPTLSLAQSPVAFSVYEDTGLFSGSEFQYTCQLTYWTGSASVSGSYDYYLTKYPNTSGVGIFDLSRVLNSSLNQLSYDFSSSVLYYKAAFNYNYLSGSVRVSGSNLPTLVSGLYKALDGYALFPEPINQNVPSKTPHWPIMTDSNISQSFQITDKGRMGVYVGGTGDPQPDRIFYQGKSNGNTYFLPTGSAYLSNSTGQIVRFPIGPAEADFPASILADLNFNGQGTWVRIQAASGSTNLGTPINFIYECAYKYEPIRIMWKNRYGQFDYQNFYKANYKTFNTDQRTYQPQLGSWDATSLSYNTATNNSQKYIVNTTEQLTVNSDWLQESFNEIYKQLLVSDELYWMYDQANNLVKPLSILTNSVRFKTGVNDKLIQYTIDFSIGQTFKLII